MEFQDIVNSSFLFSVHICSADLVGVICALSIHQCSANPRIRLLCPNYCRAVPTTCELSKKELNLSTCFFKFSPNMFSNGNFLKIPIKGGNQKQIKLQSNWIAW